MATAGVKSTQLGTTALADDVLANRDGSLTRVPVASLAAQLSASGAVADRIDEVEGLFTTNTRVAATWTDLLAASGDQDGQGGEVLDADAGTHLQATATGYDGASVANGGRYAWNATWSRWVRIGDSGLAGKASVADMVAVQALTQLEYLSTTTGPIIRDLTGVMSATKPCLYIPRVYRYQRNGVVYSGVVTNAECAELAGYCRVTISNAYYAAVYLNTSTQAYVVVTSAAGIPDLNITGRANTVLVYAGYAANYSAKMKVVDAEKRFETQLEFPYPIVVEQDIASGDTLLMIPRFYERSPWGENTLTARRPPDGSQYWPQTVASSITVPRTHWFDKLAALRAETFLKTVDGPGVGAGGGIAQHIIARSMGRIVRSPYQLAGAVPGGAAANQCAYSRDIDAITYKEGKIGSLATPAGVDLADGYFTDRGFTRGLQLGGGDGPYAGIDMPDTRAATWGFARVYVKTSSPGNFGRPRVILWKDGSAVASDNLLLEELVSDTIAIYSLSRRLLASYDKVTIGTEPNPTAATWTITGVQWSSGSATSSWIMRADLPTQEGPAARLTSLETDMEAVASRSVIGAMPSTDYAIPEHLFVAKGRPLQIYPQQLFRDRAEGLSYEMGLRSSGSAENAYYPTAQVDRHALRLDAIELGNAATLELREHAAGRRTYRKVRPVIIHRAPATQATSPKLLGVGDSLTEFELMTFVREKLIAMGMSPTLIGTIPDDGGQLSEGRLGITYASMVYADTTQVSPVAVGAEAAYLAMSEGDKKARNPFLRAATAGDTADHPTYVKNGYVFDMRHYLDRFGFADPDAAHIMLGTNDLTRKIGGGTPTYSEALAQVEAGFEIIYNQTRAALPDAALAFGVCPVPYGENSDVRWHDLTWPILVKRQMQLIAAARATDPNVYLLPHYGLVSAELGWQTAAVTVDADLGIFDTAINDTTHPRNQARREMAESVAAFFACQAAGV